MYKIAVFFLILINFTSVRAKLITQSVAEVNSKYLTSRQVVLTALLSVCMKGPCRKTAAVSTKVKSDLFMSQLSKAIFERLAYFESIGVFEDYEPISKTQLNRVMNASISRGLQFNQQEVLKSHRIKMLAKKYIDFKDKNLSVYISNAEAKKYYLQKKAKYPSGKLKDHLASIKKLLQEKQKRRRVEDWVVNMQSKYKVKQFIN